MIVFVEFLNLPIGKLINFKIKILYSLKCRSNFDFKNRPKSLIMNKCKYN